MLQVQKNIYAVIPKVSIDKFEMWNKVKFDIMFVGDDWYGTEKWNNFKGKFEKVGVKIIYFPYTKGTSSTLINETLNKLRDKEWERNKFEKI